MVSASKIAFRYLKFLEQRKDQRKDERTSAFTAPPPHVYHTEKPSKPPEVPEHWFPKHHVNLHPNLKIISQLESSGGKFTHHQPSSGGEFHTALGEVGLKPMTAYDFYSKNSELKKEFPGLDNQDKFIKELKHNHNLYTTISNKLWSHLLTILGSVKKTAFAWRHGLGAARKASPEDIHNDKYVNKFLELAAL